MLFTLYQVSTEPGSAFAQQFDIVFPRDGVTGAEISHLAEFDGR